MLVLTRKAGETIHIGPDIKIHVVAISHSRVRVGIEAPRECRIVRGELKQLEHAPVSQASTPAPHAVAVA